MTKLWTLLCVWGPALLGYSLGWLVHHSDDWSGPAVVAPVGALITFFSYRFVSRLLAKTAPDARRFLIGGMIASAGIGVAIFAMLALNLIG